MCQQGQAEIEYCRNAEREELLKQYQAFERGEIDLTDDDLKRLAVQMLMLSER